MVSALCSCRASRQSSVGSLASDSVMVEAVDDRLSADDFFSVISASRELRLSGIRVEFYPPDSLHPAPRAAPKAIYIESAHASDSIKQAVQEQSTAKEHSTVNLKAASDTKVESHATVNADILRPAHWLVHLSIVCAVFIIIFAITFKIRHRNDPL